MTTPTYKYTAQAIIDGMTAIKKAHNATDTALDQLEFNTEAQLALWDDNAKQAYWTHKAEWDKEVDKMKEIMTLKAIPSLNNILENYENTERMNTKAWQSG